MESQIEQPKEQKIAEEYLSSLADLNLNSKPLINMLTILAEENMEHAVIIVKVVEQHISKVNSDVKLPVLYLLDSIVKNVGGEYIQLFSNCIVNIFCGVFEKVNEKVREKMYILRQTWNDVFTPQKLYTLDVKVNCMDPNWPITAKVVPKVPAIHVNPNFLQNDVDQSDMQAKLQAKQRHLLELQKRKLELELAATKQRLEEQEKQLTFQNEHTTRQSGLPNSVNGPIQVGSGATKVQTNLMPGQRNMFGSHIKSQDMANNFPNYRVPPQHNMPSHRPPISTSNPIMMNSVNKRDPRLARQQMGNHKQMEMKKLTGNQSMQIDGIDNSIHPPGTYDERENLIKSDNNRSNLNNKLKSRSNGGGGSNLLNKQRSSSSSISSNRKEYSKAIHLVDSKISRSSERGGSRNTSSKSSSNSPSKYDKDRSSRRRDKIDSTKRSQASKETNKIRDDKTPATLSSTSLISKSSTYGNSLTKGGSISPKSLSRQQNRRNKDTTKSPSPTKQDNKIISSENSDLPTDKRIKLSSTADSNIIKKSNSPNTTITTTTTTTTEKLDQNNEAETCKDIDLRAFESAITTTNSETVKIEESSVATSISSGKIVTTQTLIERAGEIRSNKKRPSVDNKQDDQPSTKKSKQEKIDTLFGSEDVDLRTQIPNLVVGGLIAPPPPNISNENENWDKVKGATKPVNRKISPAKSSLDDVRAKLAKAARNGNYNLGKIRKNIAAKSPDLEESQDGTDDNIRTIISQAQELFDTENINADQYHTLVKTVIQINETNKLKEAQRRESLLDTNNTANNSTKSVEPSTVAVFKQKEQRKRMPRIPKNDKSSIDNSELKGLESQIPPPSSAGQTSSYSDMPPGREEKETKRKRQKESKWSTATPWEQQQQQQQQQKNALLSQKSWLQSNSRTTTQTNQSYPSSNKSGAQNSGAPVRGSGSSLPNPWQNPPAIIFANPIQQMAAASSHLTPSAAMSSTVTHHFSNSVDNPQADLVRTIPIDGVAKEIRVYDDVAIVFMDWDQPREIGFQNGQRRLIIDDQEPMALNFNDDFKTITFNGSVHRIKFGFPSRELYIDSNWYECYFGGPPLSIPLDGQMHVIKIEGPPPQVNIGMLRQDLVVGKINLIVDAHIIIPVFLDAKPQTFELNQIKHTIQFADQLTTVLIDNDPILVEFGGLPKSVNLGDKKYFIRFGTLPHGIVPGRTNIKNMKYHRIKKIEEQTEYSPAAEVSAVTAAVDSGVVEDVEMKDLNLNVPPTTTSMNVGNAVVTDIPQKTEPVFATTPATSEVENQNTTSAASLPALGNVNIDELFQKLIASGILNNQTKVQNKTEEETNAPNTTSPIKKEPIVTQIDLSKPESIKTRQAGIVSKLFCGMQCSSCGLRFPPEQTMKYSQHLDWHFRQNRRDRDSTRKAHSRKWYYDLADWIQYEEIEDIEDREKNWFESQQNDSDHLDDNSNQRLNSPPPSCPAGPGDVDRACDVCHEKFEQFYNEELEEWHLRSAIRVEEQLYHPICYQDFKASLNQKKEDTPPPTDENNDNYDDDSVIIVKQEKSEEGINSVDTECLDDDDVIEVPIEEPSITEILDDDDAVEIRVADLPVDDENNKNIVDEPIKETETEKQNKDMSMEDDLVIQEPHIPFTDLDTYVERDPEELNSENSTSQSQFSNIKIKEEPKDADEEEEEEDAFEDVGTFAAVEVVQDSLDKITDTTIRDADDSNSIHIIENENDDSVIAASVLDAEKSLVSMDGNINITDVPSSSTIGVNKIRINITKNVISNNNISNNNNIDERNKSDNSVSTIPVITTTTNSSSSSIIKLFNNNSSNQDKNDSNSATNSINSKSDKTATTTTTNTNNLTEIRNIDDLSVKSSNGSTNNKQTIEFSYKSELENVVFNEIPITESGFETSGLCSIM